MGATAYSFMGIKAARIQEPRSPKQDVPPTGFYRGGQKDPGWILAFLLVASYYCGSHWMSHYRHEAPMFDLVWQTICTTPHRDQFNSRTKPEMSEHDRTFTLLGIDCSTRPESLIRWILAVLHELGASCMRIVIQWLESPRPGRAPGPATAIVVLQTDHPQTAALHFHRNEQYEDDSHEREEFKAQEARDERTNSRVRCG